MEIELTKTKQGVIRYPRKFKAMIVKEKREKQITWKEMIDLIQKTHGLKINYDTLTNWSSWYDLYKNNLAGKSSKISGHKVPNWNAIEDKELKLGVEIGLTDLEIANCMNENPDAPRTYTIQSISSRKARKGLTKVYQHQVDYNKKEEVRELLKKVEQSLVYYKSAQHIQVRCNKCNHEWRKESRAIRNDEQACPMCMTPANSYQELYVIEFTNFANPSVKVGISIDYQEKRKNSFPTHTLIAIYKTTFKTAKEIENLIMKQYGIYRTTPPELFNNGGTECYDISMTNKINKTIKEQLYG